MSGTSNKRARGTRRARSWQEVYEGACREHVIGDKDAELALLTIAWTTEDVELMRSLEPNDFHDPTNRFFFGEYRLMIEAGEPFGDSVATSRWFCSDAAKRRALEILDEKNLPELVAIQLQKYADSFFSSAHKDYYLKCIRKDRLRRAIFFVATKMIEENLANNREPWKVIDVLQKNVQQLWTKCYEHFSEEMESQ